MKHLIKRYYAETIAAGVIIAAGLFIAAFVMQSRAILLLDLGALALVLTLFFGVYFYDFDPDFKYNDYNFSDTTKPDATPEYNEDGDLVVNGRGVFDPFVTTFGEYLAWFFGWDNPANVYPYRVPHTPDDITADTLQTAFISVGVYDPIELTPIQPDANPRGSFDGFHCWDSVARFVRLNWHEQINVEVYSDVKEYIHVFSVDGIEFEFITAYDWGAPIE